MAASPDAPRVLEPPRGFPEYSPTVHDTRFTVVIRNEIEDLCRRLINRQKKLKQDRKVDEEKWFNERVQGDKGPLHTVLRYVKSKGCADESGSFVLVLGASNDDDSGKFGISPSTHDFPWFTIVMNDFCNSSSEESFNAWQLVFNKEGQIRAKALSDESVSILSEDDKVLLEKVGFRLPGRQRNRKMVGNANRVGSNAAGGKPSNGKSKKANNQKKEEELDPNDPLYEFRVRDRQMSKGFKRIRAISRKVRMNAGMTKERRERTVLLVDRLSKKFYDVMERLEITAVEDQAARKTTSTQGADVPPAVTATNEADNKNDVSATAVNDAAVQNANDNGDVKEPDAATPSAPATDAPATPAAKRPLSLDGDDMDDTEGDEQTAKRPRTEEVEMMADPTVCIGGSAGLLLEGEGGEAKKENGAESEPEEPGKGWKILEVVELAAETAEGRAAAVPTTEGTAAPQAEGTAAPQAEDAAARKGEDTTAPQAEDTVATQTKGTEALQAEDTVAPQAENTVATQAEDTVALQAEDTAAPQAEDTVAPQAENTVATQAEDTVALQAEDTAAPQAVDTTAPQGEDTVVPQAENTTAPEAENTATPKAEDTAAPQTEDVAAPTEKPTGESTTEPEPASSS